MENKPDIAPAPPPPVLDQSQKSWFQIIVGPFTSQEFWLTLANKLFLEFCRGLFESVAGVFKFYSKKVADPEVAKQRVDEPYRPSPAGDAFERGGYTPRTEFRPRSSSQDMSWPGFGR